MDDLAGLDWNASSGGKSSSSSRPSAPLGSNYFPSIRAQATPPPPATQPTNLPGQQQLGGGGISKSPASTPAAGKASGPAKDSFANLYTSSSAGSGGSAQKNLSLAEQQRRLQLHKLQQAGSGAGNGASEEAWMKMGAGGAGGAAGVPRPVGSSPQATGTKIQAPLPIKPMASSAAGKSTESEDDILAAFSADAPVDRSSHFPPASSNPSSAGTPAMKPRANGGGGGLLGDDDDDPFGLGTSAPSSSYTAPQVVASGDDFDILGDLGKPVSELPPRRQAAPARADSPEAHQSHPADKGVAELVDMGFSAEKAQEALEATDGNVQAAVSWLLNAAHAEAKTKTQRPSARDSRDSSRHEANDRSSSARRQPPERTQTPERDAAQRATELGSSLWKGANALWKSSKKQLDKAVADFNSDSDSSQPKWMRDASNSRSSSAARPDKGTSQPELTDEAMMLDSPGSRPAPRARNQDLNSGASSARASREQSPAMPVRPSARQEASPRQAWQHNQQPSPARSKLSRQMVEEEEAQMYVSSARRKKPAPKPATNEADLLNGSSSPAAPVSTAASKPRRPPPAKSAPIAVRPAAKARPIPTVSAIALKSSTQHRTAGTSSFKRGDYSAAETSYTSAITALPSSHPLVILLLTNRATTRLKVGDTKGVLADADQAIELIGPSRGAGEAIEVADEDGSGKTSNKDMVMFWGKAVMKRAEAYEHMERWSDAAAAWREAVEGGIGGANAIQGRNRCEAAARPKPKPAPKAVAPTRAPAARSKPVRMTGKGAESAEAVSRLREANREAERVDDEKFRLSDSVDERVNGWRKGKESNLRALLGSLDTVLWADSGWKKVGMGELLVPGKVKIAYMKGIAKVHPDKLPTTATTEQVMISGMVFSTLNEAWDKFKAENGM